ncbi:AI-2E family transporter [Arsenicicoccus sp. oral taxon 190]|uniref:AI-2E family transporter n=1 Tax=Arsenicicoccus sp. oral taxon 190 TaxID=1658671 RepID=UPI00067A2D91|nr:AI-2E family transporter [Arsenicicoccus sp. oral taxon 190]AKT52632.1 hypothetical protein ADJ73_06440 [Arsenicicoccus sp. oral taxon 190]
MDEQPQDTQDAPGSSKVTKLEARDVAHEASLAHGARIADRREREWTQPGSMPRMLVILLGLAAAWVAVQALQGSKDLVAPVFFALNLMIAAYPLKGWLHRKGVPEWICSIVAGLVVFLVIIGFFFTLGWAVASLVIELPQYSDKFQELYNQSLAQLGRLGLSEAKLEAQLKGINPQSIMGYVTTVLTGLQSFTGLLAVILTVLFFLMMDATGWSRRMDIGRRHHPRIVEALDAFGGGVRRYWIVSSVFGAIVAVLDWVALLILGVPLAAVWAVLSFLTNYIPNIGFVIGLIPPALMALLAKGPMAAVWVIVAYCVLNFVVQSIIQPKFAGDAIGVTPTLSFLSLLFWASIMGPMGAILALPMTLLLKAVLVDSDPRARWANAFLAADPLTAEAPSVKDAVDPDDEHDNAIA